MSTGFVYILTNDRRTVLYVGCTSNLKNRVYLHRKRLIAGFSQKYNLIRLVHYELFPDMHAARQREKTLKDGPRKRKLALIQRISTLLIGSGTAAPVSSPSLVTPNEWG